ncbi:MAG TPA: hypothetical protein VKA38_13930 [Draconibacterium sp.]|nr:hypothetical protein [Draconibacterium sp.]
MQRYIEQLIEDFHEIVADMGVADETARFQIFAPVATKLKATWKISKILKITAMVLTMMRKYLFKIYCYKL